MKRPGMILLLLFVLLAVCLNAFADAEVSFTPLPEDNTLYLFWQPAQGELPPAPQVKVSGKSVKITGLIPWGIPEEYMQTYVNDMAWGQVASGKTQDQSVVFLGDPEEMRLSFGTEGSFTTIEVQLHRSKEYKGEYSVSLEMKDRKGRILHYTPETGLFTLEYANLSADYGPDGMLLRCEYRKDAKKATTFYKYERIDSELPVFDLVYASYEDKKTTEIWDLYRPEKNTKKPKHISTKKLPFKIADQKKANRYVAERKAGGLALFASPSEEAAYTFMQVPSLPKCKSKTGKRNMTCTFSGLKNLHISEKDMRKWTYDPEKDTWTPSGEITPDRLTLVFPWDKDSGSHKSFQWITGTEPSWEWEITVEVTPWKAEHGWDIWSINVKRSEGDFLEYTFYESGFYDGPSPFVTYKAGEREFCLEYSPEGYLRKYTVWDGGEDGGIKYTYEFSSLSGGFIVHGISTWEKGWETLADYGRDINDYWYILDESGKKTPCDRPEEADRCPPLPVR